MSRSPSREAIPPDEGLELVGKPDASGKQKREEYTTNDYHQPSDQVKDDWNLRGMGRHGKLLLAVGFRVANAAKYAEWSKGADFGAVRERSLSR